MPTNFKRKKSFMFNSPIIQTERLILRPLSYTDSSDMFEYSKSELVGPNAGWEPHFSIKSTREVIDYYLQTQLTGSLMCWAIELKGNHKMIGTVELYNVNSRYKAEIGYSLNPDYWNNGYITEASKEIVKFAFLELKLVKLEIGSFTDNYASIKVAEKLGFNYEGTLKLHYKRIYDSKVFDEVIYGLTLKEYLSKLE